MTTFYLIRHGDIPFGPGDPGLSPLGQSQAARAGSFLKTNGIQHIFASPLRRAFETAIIIAASLTDQLDRAPSPVFIDLRLRERINWGDLPNQSWAAFNVAWDQATANRDYVPPDGISAHQAAANLANFFSEKVSQFPNAAVAAVCHSGIISDYLIDFIPPEKLALLNPAWPIQQHALITHCSITILHLGPDGPHLEALALLAK